MRLQSSSSQVHADAAGDGLVVDDGICRAADGGVDADGVLEGLLGEDLGQAQVFPDHLDDAHAGQVREHVAARIDGRDGGVVRQRDAERLGHAGHGGSGAHGVAGAGRARVAGLGGQEVVHGDLAGPDLLVQLPDGGAGADVLATELAIEHGGRRSRTARAHRSWQRPSGGRGGLVAAHQQHDGVDGVAAMDSSTSMLARLRVSMAVGGGWTRRWRTPGTRRAIRRLRGCPLTCSASLRKWALQGVSSLQVLQMPMMGLPWNSWSGMPLVLHPGAVHETVLVLGAEPFGGAQLDAAFSCRR